MKCIDWLRNQIEAIDDLTDKSWHDRIFFYVFILPLTIGCIFGIIFFSIQLLFTVLLLFLTK